MGLAKGTILMDLVKEFEVRKQASMVTVTYAQTELFNVILSPLTVSQNADTIEMVQKCRLEAIVYMGSEVECAPQSVLVLVGCSCMSSPKAWAIGLNLHVAKG